MKSFSSLSFASGHTEALDLAFEAVQKDPLALFTNFQWFLYAGKDTIFFTAFSKEAFDGELGGEARVTAGLRYADDHFEQVAPREAGAHARAGNVDAGVFGDTPSDVGPRRLRLADGDSKAAGRVFGEVRPQAKLPF